MDDKTTLFVDRSCIAKGLNYEPHTICIRIDRTFLEEGDGENRSQKIVRDWLKELIIEAVHEERRRAVVSLEVAGGENDN